MWFVLWITNKLKYEMRFEISGAFLKKISKKVTFNHCGSSRYVSLGLVTIKISCINYLVVEVEILKTNSYGCIFSKRHMQNMHAVKLIIC